MSSSCYVSGLYYYPVKSLKGISLESAEIDEFGIRYDRRFMLIDDKHKFVTQRTHPLLSQLSVTTSLSSSNDLNTINIHSKSFGILSFNMNQFSLDADITNVVVWGDSVEAVVLKNKETQCLSEFLGLNVRIVYMPASSFRQIDRQYYAEDNRKRLVIGDISFEMVKPCSRCVMTTIDSNGLKSVDKEPLKTLSQYRKNDFGICFGQNLVHLSKGEIRIGDVVTFE